MSGSDSAPSSLKLRIAEAVALFATVLAVGLTALLEPATAAVESNPVAAGLLDALGWTGAGIVAVVAEAALFSAWRRLSARGYPRAALGAGAGIAAVGVADVLVNLVVLSRLGIPETARLGHYGGATAAVGFVALLAYFRSEVRVAVDMLVNALGDVTSRLSAPDLSAARKSLVIALAVLIAVSGIVTFGPLPAAGPVNADKAVIDDFNDGFDATWDTIDSGYEINPSITREGDNAVRYVGGSGFNELIADQSDNQVSAWVYPTAVNLGGAVNIEIQQSGGSFIGEIGLQGDGTFRTTDGGTTVNGGSYNANKWYQLIATGVNDGDGTYSVEARTADGSVVFDKDGLSTSNGDNMGQIALEVFSGVSEDIHWDYVAEGGQQIGQPVSGTLTDSDGTAIDSGIIELRQNGSVIDSTTTNSTGDYKISTVSDGNYTIRASTSGFVNKSREITVSGSPVTADLTLNEEGTYVQTFELDDNTGAFPADETSLVLERYDPALHTFRPVTSRALNSDAQASFRLTEGLLYRVEARNVVPNQRMAVQSWAGIQADRSLGDPYILETDDIDADAWYDTPTATPTATPLTPTATPAPGATPTPTTTPAQRLPDPNQDSDGDGVPDWYDPDDDGDGTRDVNDPNRPSYDGYGPSYLSECTLSSGQDGAKIQYYDPTYNTTALDYSINGPDGEVYNGTKTFTAPVGYWSECVAGSLTGNVTDEPASEVGLNGTATLENGSAVPLDTDFDASSNFESFGPMGDPADSPVEQATAFGLAGLGVALSYLASRRTNVLEGLSQRSPVDPVFAGGSAASVLFGLEFSSGGQVSAAVANGAQAAAPLAGVGAVGLGGYWAYKRFIASQDVTVVAGEE